MKIKKYSAAASGILAAALLVTEGLQQIPSAGAFTDDGVTELADLMIIRQCLLGTRELSGEEADRYDIDGDGIISTFDFIAGVNEITDIRGPEKPAEKQLSVNMVMQNPELPTGCEVTSLAMVISHAGFDAGKTALADLMPRLGFYYSDGYLHGADYITTFPGSPWNDSGYGCYTPCMVTTAQRYFDSIGDDRHYLEDLTGKEFDELFDYVADGRPVMIWATISMINPYQTSSWITPDGRRITWMANEHCLVLTGYDKNKNLVYVNDPLKGRVSYDMSLVRNRYNQIGKYAGVISER